MTTKTEAFWKALDDLSPEDREAIGNAARAMLEDVAELANVTTCAAGVRYGVSLLDRTALGSAAGAAVREAMRWDADGREVDT